jgi:hypothetical protein
VSSERREELLAIRTDLEAQAPRGAAADPYAAKQRQKKKRQKKKAGRPS